MIAGVLIISSLLNFSFTLIILNIACRHYMIKYVALEDFEVSEMSELDNLIEYSDIASLKLAGKVLARTNN